MKQFRTRWEEFLDIAYARLTNQAGFKSRVREGGLSNMLWERTARVVAQMPTGKVQALTCDDIGKSRLMDLVWHKYVIPGANTDYSFFTKMRLWDYYSMVYGAAPAIYNFRVDDEYVGPDWTVLDPRYVFPQAGRLSFQRCQHVFIEAFHNKEYLESKKGMKGWNNESLAYIAANYKEDAQPDNSQHTTHLQQDRGQTTDLHKGEIQLITKYERGKKGRWITFAPQYDNKIVRDIPNPHKNGRLPVVFKFCFPLIDSIWGMGDVERGESLQKAVDTYINLSMDFSKFKLYPVMWYKDGVNASNLRYEPGAKWKLTNGEDSAGFMNISGNYTQEMTQGYQFLSGALQRQNGTTQTNIATSDSDPAQGKTTEAIQTNNARENSRDNWDRTMLEEAYEELANGMMNLIGSKQPTSIEFHIFDDDIKKIYDSGFKDVLEVFDSAKKPKIITNESGEPELSWELNGKGAAKVTIGPDDVKGAYRFYLDAGTTMATDDQQEYERLQSIGEMLSTPEGQQLLAGLQQEGRQFSAGAFLKKLFIASGTQDWEDIIPEVSAQQPAQGGAQQFDPSMLSDPQAMAMYQQSQAQGQGQTDQAQVQAQSAQTDAQYNAAMKQIQQLQLQNQRLQLQMQQAKQAKAPQEMIAYQDAPPMTKAQMEIQAGMQPDPIHAIEEQALQAQHVASMKAAANPQPTVQTPGQQPAMETITKPVQQAPQGGYQ